MKTKAYLSVVVPLMILLVNILAYGDISVPVGFEVKVFANVSSPTSTAFDWNGRLFVREIGGKMKILENTNDDRVTDLVKTFATGFTYPLDVTVGLNGSLFVAD
ncbi:MAG TPA: hypothetical protein VI387_10890, partial [Candidatus Brocadiales bacterium]|nr:hypothetical protein [Candidatus Brocadiales bacterium]